MLQGDEVLSSANTVAGIVYQKREDVAYYFGLRRMNDSLINENTRLRMRLAALKGVDTLKDSTATLAYTRIINLSSQELTFLAHIPAEFLPPRVGVSFYW